MNTGTVVLLGAVGLGAGAGAWYLFDPKEGAKRRRRLRDKAIVIGYEARRQSRKALKSAHDATDAVTGLFADKLSRGDNGQDGLADRVQAKVSKLTTHPSVKATARHGKVTLSGPILAAEAGSLIAHVAAMRGVNEVVDKLEVIWPESNREPREGFERSSGNGLTNHPWSKGERVMASAGGTLGLLGLGLLTRGLIARRA